MKLNKIARTLAGLGLMSALFLNGCESTQAKMSVGKVDTAVLLQDDPEYQNMSISFMKERTDLRQSSVKKMEAAKGDEAKVKALQSELRTTIEEFDGKWQKKTEDFLRTRHESIQATAEGIAKRKKIDIVVIDSKEYPTVEWGGVDMTKDMQLAMSSEAAPDAAATPKDN